MKEKIKKLLNKKELSIVKKLNTPVKVQNFLDSLPFNFEKTGQTYRSPRQVIEINSAHCLEGALLASLCLSYHGFKNYLLDLKVKKSAVEDSDHTLCIFKINNHWGALSKTNHSVWAGLDNARKWSWWNSGSAGPIAPPKLCVPKEQKIYQKSRPNRNKRRLGNWMAKIAGKW